MAQQAKGMKYWREISMVLLVSALFVAVRMSCNGVSEDAEKEILKTELAAEKQKVSDRDSALQRFKDSAELEDQKRDSILIDLNNKQDVIVGAFGDAKERIAKLDKQLKDARANQDTATAWRLVDSLKSEIDVLIVVNEATQQYADTLGVIYEAQLAGKDAVILKQKEAYDSLTTSFNKVSKTLTDQLNTPTKKDKRISVGFHVGYGAMLHDGRLQTGPVVSVGVNFKIF